MQCRRAGFTLLEVILAMSLSILVLLALALAINLHLRVNNVGREDVERAQLARALLRIIGDDLRGAVWYVPEEVSVPGLPEIADEGGAVPPAGSGGAGQGGGRGGGGGSSPELPPGSPGGSEGTANGEEFLDTSATGLPTTPGLYGDATWLQLDVSRPPRPEQYQILAGQDATLLTADMVSEIRTVTYYLGSLGAAGTTIAAGGVGTGLARREKDRAVTWWSAEIGGLDSLDTSPLAAEVVGLEFRYFDGTEWVFQWDSDARQGLPLAVEIAIAVGETEEAAPVVSLFETHQPTDAGESTYTIYRLLVHLPTAEPTTLETSQP